MIFNQGRGYYGRVDELNEDISFSATEPAKLDENGEPLIPDDAVNFTTKDVGVTTNPMGNTLQSLKQRITEGTGRIEFSFLRGGKGSAQSPNPETFGKAERTDIRELLKVNDMKTSTHAPVHADSLAGFGEGGFNNLARANALKEIKRAIDFAGEATKGGAIVFHLHEWQRPLSQIDDGKAKFRMYEEEDTESPLIAVDKRTGKAIEAINKNRVIHRPIYITAKDKNLVGKKDSRGNTLKENDWVDIDGNLIPRNADTKMLFNRIPKFTEDKKNFEIENITWDKLQEITQDHNKGLPEEQHLEPEEMFVKIQTETKILQQKGSSLYYIKDYDRFEDAYVEAKELIDEYNRIKDTYSDDRKYLADVWLKSKTNNKTITIEALHRQLEGAKDSMRHVHEASSAADVQAKELTEIYESITSAKKYGLSKTADTIAKAGLYAMDVYRNNKDKYGLEDPIYVAPENWDVKMYGSHPKEYREAILKSRERMVELLKKRNVSEKEAKKLAANHIKGTLDIGHMNMYRYYFESDPKDSPEERDKKFNKWMLDETEKLVKEGIVGHIHLSDNFGYDDEHLTPGQGNIPMKEFLKRMEKHGINDLIIETGSYNISTAQADTMAHIGSPLFGPNRIMRQNNVHQGHFGYQAPGFFIAGAYVPSNEWKAWSDVPLE